MQKNTHGRSAKEYKEAKKYKKETKRLKRVKDIIKHKRMSKKNGAN